MGLTIRMVLALALAAMLTLGTIAALVWLVTSYPWGWLPVVLALGFAAEGWGTAKRRRSKKSRKPVEADRQRVETAVERLSLVADVTPPPAVVEAERVPLSWTLWVPRRRPAIHVTTGLLDRLDDEQLEAVVAHELMHVTNRDAAIMTLLAALPAAFLRGLRQMIKDNPISGYFSVLFYGLWITPTALLLLGTSRIVSRHRELVADGGAARLTGSPAAVAGALMALSESLTSLRDLDLRRVSPGEVFHFVPADEPSGARRVWATHPRLDDRLERLGRMEAELQGVESRSS